MTARENSKYHRSISLKDYQAVLGAALEAARVIKSTKASSPLGKIAFVEHEALKLLRAYPITQLHEAGNSSVFRIFEILKMTWPEISSDQVEFDQFIGAQGDLWEKFMTEFPLGEYAQMASDILKKEGLLSGAVLELGAGVGNTSRLLHHETDLENYTRTDLNLKLLKDYPFSKKISLYNFNHAGKWSDLSSVFAVNALHCADDKLASLKHIQAMLKTGGTLLMGEGTPSPEETKPWALNYLCGFFDGWWDKGGFLEREQWFNLLTKAGFHDIQYARMTAADLDLGGVIWAKKA